MSAATGAADFNRPPRPSKKPERPPVFRVSIAFVSCMRVRGYLQSRPPRTCGDGGRFCLLRAGEKTSRLDVGRRAVFEDGFDCTGAGLLHRNAERARSLEHVKNLLLQVETHRIHFP